MMLDESNFERHQPLFTFITSPPSQKASSGQLSQSCDPDSNVYFPGGHGMQESSLSCSPDVQFRKLMTKFASERV